MSKSTSIVFLFVVCILSVSCAAKQSMGVNVEVATGNTLEELVPAQRALEDNHFSRDHAESISEENLKTVLNAPVFLQEKARVGVVQVADRYETYLADPTQETTAKSFPIDFLLDRDLANLSNSFCIYIPKLESTEPQPFM